MTAMDTPSTPRNAIEFFAEGLPKGQPRPRAFSRGGHAAVYDPGTAEGWKGQIAIAAQPHLPNAPIVCPVSLELWFAMPRPKSHFRTRIDGYGLLKDDAPTWHIGKPDCDNLAKAVLDALTTLRMWADDALVASLSVSKVYGERPGCSVKIRRHPKDTHP